MKMYGAIEAQSEIQEKDEKRLESMNNFSNIGYIAAFLIAALIGALLLTSHHDFRSIYETSASKLEASGLLVWTLRREGYEPLSMFTSSKVDTLTYTVLNKYYAIIEPYAPMLLYAEDYEEDDTNYFEVEVCSMSDSSKCSYGTLSNVANASVAVTTACTPYDTFSVSITKFTVDGEKQGKSGGVAVCLYVRRELRGLTDNDLSKTMDAMYTLWSTSDEEGRSLYGDNFHNSTYFVEAHHFNAAWKDSDHIHEGQGFLTQHIKMTNMFELSMQAVDPSVSLPYWDFTIESANGDTVFDSFAFKTITFGSLTKPVDSTWGWTYRNDSIQDARIHSGRWKHLKTDYNTKYSQLYSNFGYLRAPWNTNPSPYVSRFAAYTTELPTCSAHYHLIQYSSLADFLGESPYSPHASVHGAIGSVYGCDLMDPLREAGLIVSSSEQNLLCQKWGFMLKELYRKNFLVANDDCTYTSLDYDGVDCSIACLEEKYDNMGLQMQQLISSSYVGSLTTTQWDEWRDFVCSGVGTKIFVGDHLESASPADPSFWPMHPTLDRLLHAKLMSGTFSSMDWVEDGEDVCDKAQCYESGTIGYYDACCYGHNEDDQLLDFINADKSAGTGPTNAEILSSGDPTSTTYSLPFIYDNFEWSHCDEDFEGYLTGTAVATAAKPSATTTAATTATTTTTSTKATKTTKTTKTKTTKASSSSTTRSQSGSAVKGLN